MAKMKIINVTGKTELASDVNVVYELDGKEFVAKTINTEDTVSIYENDVRATTFRIDYTGEGDGIGGIFENSRSGGKEGTGIGNVTPAGSFVYNGGAKVGEDKPNYLNDSSAASDKDAPYVIGKYNVNSIRNS